MTTQVHSLKSESLIFIHIYYLPSWAPASVENLSFVGFLNFVNQQRLWYSSSTMTLYFFRQRAIMTRYSLSWIKVIFLKSKLVASELGKLLVFWTDFCWIAQLLHHHHQSHCLELTTPVEIEFSDGLVGTLILSMRVRGAATTSRFWKNVNRSTSSDNVLIINLPGQWAKRQAHSKNEIVWGDTQKVTRQQSISYFQLHYHHQPHRPLLLLPFFSDVAMTKADVSAQGKSLDCVQTGPQPHYQWQCPSRSIPVAGTTTVLATGWSASSSDSLRPELRVYPLQIRKSLPSLTS